jgi:hypothetical protein
MANNLSNVMMRLNFSEISDYSAPSKQADESATTFTARPGLPDGILSNQKFNFG